MASEPFDALLDVTPRPSADVTSVEVDGETVAYSPRTGVHRLDPVATVLWRCLDGATSLAELATDLADVFAEEDPARLRSDLLRYARDLRRAGLVEGGEAHGPAGS